MITVIVVAAASLIVAGMTGQRRSVPPVELTADVTAASPALQALRLAQRNPPTVTTGGAEVRWWSTDDGLLYEEAHRYANIFSAHYAYLSSRKKNYESDYPGLVRSVDPGHLPVDRIDVFCGNVQRSRTPELEDCAIWGANMQLGQYVLYVEATDLRLNLRDFRMVVAAMVEHARHVLGS